ncbi:MAG TPA: hypothetical protein VHF06_13635, partial [Pseudonocardiaceae bacterium]|nr:hypothetical protein [Pseudonocardiaceae bacterium]
ARAAELRAASDAYRELRDRVTERVAHWCARPATRSLLAARARAALGADAVVSDARDGGVVATVAGRRLDLSARTIAVTAVDALGADVAKLWSP